MLKKIFKTICIIILLLLIILLFFAVVKPIYTNYKSNKKEVIVDKSGKRATSENKVIEEVTDKDNNENKWKLERKEYEPIIFDDRILLYEGNINSGLMNELMNILIEDIESQTFSKVDVKLNDMDISWNNKDMYSSSLINFKNSILENNMYIVEFEYNELKSTINKVIIKNI